MCHNLVMQQLTSSWSTYAEWSIVYRLMKRAEIRRSIPDRKSVQQGKPDRIADLLEEAAAEIYRRDMDIKTLEAKLFKLSRNEL